MLADEAVALPPVVTGAHLAQGAGAGPLGTGAGAGAVADLQTVGAPLPLPRTLLPRGLS